MAGGYWIVSSLGIQPATFSLLIKTAKWILIVLIVILQWRLKSWCSLSSSKLAILTGSADLSDPQHTDNQIMFLLFFTYSVVHKVWLEWTVESELLNQTVYLLSLNKTYKYSVKSCNHYLYLILNWVCINLNKMQSIESRVTPSQPL